ncbi:MCE family protein [Synechococcus sp. GreenBA-s]|jgi:phospholipid/cholesterol/gamma-HCH transport system substrate-binding protein|nr:MCE family protein [Synechococcus sp. GreenBA-s]
MRRSVREAIVGFTLLAGVAGAAGIWLWIKGVNISGRNWTVKVRFPDAAGLAERSSVTYRGVVVGTVRRLEAQSDAVVAELEIQDPDLRLARPVLAEVQAASLLGGDAMVALLTAGSAPGPGTPGPRSPACDAKTILCSGSELKGESAATLSTVTAMMQRLLDQADKEKLVSKLAETTRSFDATSKQADRFLRDSQGLVKELNAAVKKADPTLTNLNRATADAARATKHLNSIVSAFDNPQTIGQLKSTAANAEKLTARWEAVGGDVNKLSADPQFMDGIRSVAVGLGKFFEELYPAQTGAAKDRASAGKDR